MIQIDPPVIILDKAIEHARSQITYLEECIARRVADSIVDEADITAYRFALANYEKARQAILDANTPPPALVAIEPDPEPTREYWYVNGKAHTVDPDRRYTTGEVLRAEHPETSSATVEYELWYQGRISDMRMDPGLIAVSPGFRFYTAARVIG